MPLCGSSPRAWGRWVTTSRFHWLSAVHPHVRGADVADFAARYGYRGSSPRAWGRCFSRKRWILKDTVHPHVRGADIRVRTSLRSERGSSPRAWGRCRSSPLPCDRSTVHPHVRGADAPRRIVPATILTGSSPRAWGRSFSYVALACFSRFIPTCVGQIIFIGRSSVACGGSSPRAWGRWLQRGRGRSWRTVHPHVRGADEQRKNDCYRDFGSSPRAWGRSFYHLSQFSHCRFIPTCVGQMPGVAICLFVHKVHPHVRGADTERNGFIAGL